MLYPQDADAVITDGIFGISASGGTTYITYPSPHSTSPRYVEVALPGHSENNGRGIAFDGNNIWFTVLDRQMGYPYSDGKIYRVSIWDIGNPIRYTPSSIPDGMGPGKLGYDEPSPKGVGAMDFYNGKLWVISYSLFNHPDPNVGHVNRVSQLDPNNGNVLAFCDIPFSESGDIWPRGAKIGAADSLAIVDGKILTAKYDYGRIAYEYNLPNRPGDNHFCERTGNEYDLGFWHGGFDTDSLYRLWVGGYEQGEIREKCEYDGHTRDWFCYLHFYSSEINDLRLTNMGAFPYNFQEERYDNFFRGAASQHGGVEDISTTYVEQARTLETFFTSIIDDVTLEELTGKVIRAGRMIRDTVTMAGSFGNPSGTITYYLYNNRNCEDDADNGESSIIRRDPVDIDHTTGRVPPSPPFTLDFAASVSYRAYYSGDSTYRPAWSQCEPITFSRLQTLIVDEIDGTKYSDVIMPFGRPVHDEAIIDTGPGTETVLPDPTGVIFYIRYNTANCTGTGIGEAASGISTDGRVIPTFRSSSIKLNYSPEVSYEVIYSGDSMYERLESSCESITVLPPQISTIIKDQNNVTINVSSTVPKDTVIQDTANILFGVGTPPDTVARGHIIYQRFFHNEETNPHLFCNGTHTDYRVEINPTSGIIPNSESYRLDSPGIVSYKAIYEQWAKKWGEHASSSCEWIKVGLPQ